MAMMKDVFDFEPEEAQQVFAVIVLPYALKLLFGLLTDIVPLCGSRKKNWLVFGGLIQTFSMFTLAVFRFKVLGPFMLFCMLL